MEHTPKLQSNTNSLNETQKEPVDYSQIYLKPKSNAHVRIGHNFQAENLPQSHHDTIHINHNSPLESHKIHNSEINDTIEQEVNKLKPPSKKRRLDN